MTRPRPAWRTTGSPSRLEWLLFACSASRPMGYMVRGWIGGCLVASAVVAAFLGAWVPFICVVMAALGFTAWIAENVVSDYRAGRLACDCDECRVRLVNLTGDDTPWIEPRAHVMHQVRAARPGPTLRP